MKPRAQPLASPCLAPLWLAPLMLAALPASADDAERGAALYGDKCARCHDGERERTRRGACWRSVRRRRW